MTTEPPDLRFRPPSGGLPLRLAWTLVLIGLLETLVGLAQLVLRVTGSAATDRVLIVLHVMFAVTGLALAGAGLLLRHIHMTGETRLSADGLTNKEFRPRLIPWHTITEISTVRRGRYWRTRVTLTGGRRRFLVAPTTIASAPDPEFTHDVETLRAWWQRHRHG